MCYNSLNILEFLGNLKYIAYEISIRTTKEGIL